MVKFLSITKRKRLQKLKKLLTIILLLKELHSKRRHRFWVRNYLIERDAKGAFATLIPTLRTLNPGEETNESFRTYFRVTPAIFDEILQKIRSSIEKQTIRRKAISAEERFAITLRYLVSGDSMRSIAFNFRVGFSTVSNIINETCIAIWNELSKEAFPTFSEEYWEKTSKEYEEKWQFPNCVGSIDGKHVTIQAFKNVGSSYYNYKGSHSIVLMAISDANYKFIHVDIGSPGRYSDGGIFKTSTFGQYVLNSPDKLKLPIGKLLPNSNIVCPYVFTADEAFPLLKNVMRPYPGRGSNKRMDNEKSIFNYRLSRARRCVENSFGILASRFRLFRKPIIGKEETVVNIVHAAVTLHNLFLEKMPYNATLEGDLTSRSESQSGFRELQSSSSNNAPMSEGKQVRELFTSYFVNEGAVSWQNN